MNNWLLPKVIRRAYIIIKGGSFQQNEADKVLPLFKKAGLAKPLGEISVSERRKLYWRSYGSSAARKDFVRKFQHEINNLSRDSLARFEKRKPILVKPVLGSKGSYFSNGPFGSRQFATIPTARDLASLAFLFSRSGQLAITKDIKQENRYTISCCGYSNPIQFQPAGFFCVKSNRFFELMLPSRRPIVATIFDHTDQKEVFTVRRPFWWITNSIYVEVGGEEIGVIHKRWHIWRSIYDLYFGDEQFAVVKYPGYFNNRTITMKGINGEALVDIECVSHGLEFGLPNEYIIRFKHDRIPEMTAVTVALVVSLNDEFFSRYGPGGVYYFNVALVIELLRLHSSKIYELFKF